MQEQRKMKLGLFVVGSKWAQMSFLWKEQDFQGRLQETWFLSCVKQWQGHLGQTKSSQGFITTQEAQLEDASSGFGGEQSPKLPLLFLGLSLNLCYKSKSLQLLAGFLYVPRVLFRSILYRESHTLKKPINSGKEQKVQGARGSPRIITDLKSFPRGKSQW